MAIKETTYAMTGRLQLNNGTSSTGNVLTINQSLGTMAVDGWDSQKVYDIAVALSFLFEKSIVRIQQVKTTNINNES